MKYAVGQVLYVILRKEATVYPMQIVEEITKKTLEGEVTTYMVRAGASIEKVLAITDIDGEIFDSSEKAKKTLIDRVSASISQRVEQAIAKAKEWYPSGREIMSDDPLTLVKRVSMTGEQSQRNVKQPLKHSNTEIAELQAELQEEANEGALIELPDGTRAKIKSVKMPSSLQG